MRRPALALLLGCLLLVAAVSALDGYDYYQTIEYAGCDQETYQQDIVIHRTTGTAYNETSGGLETWHIYVGDHCREDYGDIRFTNSTGAELAYYLWPDYDSSSARFAVRLEGADQSGALTVWYGNPSATTTSDGDAAFHLFDQFDGTAIDTGKWTVQGGSPYIQDGTLVLPSVTNIYSKNTINLNNTIVARSKIDRMTGTNAHLIGAKDTIGSGGGIYGFGICTYSNMIQGHNIREDYAENYVDFGAAEYTNEYYICEIRKAGSTNYYSTTDKNGVVKTGSSSLNSISNNQGYCWVYAYNGATITIDWILVRTYSATPPAALTFSGEQETAAPTVSSSIRPRASATIPTLSTDLKDDLIDSLGGETVPEPGNDTINWTGLISTIGGAYTSILGPLAYTLIFSIPFLMMWITQRDMTLPGLVGALFGLFIIVRLPAEFHLVAVTFIVISIVAVIYSLVKERV